jgi:putative transposase
MPNRRRILDDLLYVHFVTFSVRRRRRLLDHDHSKRIVLGVLNELLRRFDARCIGFVIMPDHVHAGIWFPKPRQLTRFMHGWKRMSSFRIREWYRKEAPNYYAEASTGDSFWNPKYYAFEIFRGEKLEEKLTYMHANPERAGLVESATEWKWSSAGWYQSLRDVGVPITWID